MTNALAAYQGQQALGQMAGWPRGSHGLGQGALGGLGGGLVGAAVGRAMQNPYNNNTTTTQIYISSLSTQTYTTSSSTSTSNYLGTVSTGDLTVSGRLRVSPGMTLLLPDGAEIEVDATGNYEIRDESARVTYKANRVLEFNRFLNASDLLEEFFSYLAGMGVRRRELTDINVGMFVAWLIIKASEQDGAETPAQEVKLLESSVKPLALPKCRHCGRFIPRARHAQGIAFCNGEHMDRYLAKAA